MHKLLAYLPAVSRALSRLCGGPDEMVCSQVHRKGYVNTELALNWAAFIIWAEIDHCLEAWKKEHPLCMFY